MVSPPLSVNRIWLLSISTNALVRLLGGNPHSAKEQITGEELRDIVAATEELTAEERALIDDVFDAGDRGSVGPVQKLGQTINLSGLADGCGGAAPRWS